MKIIKGLWYQCKLSHSYFTEGNWYYSPANGCLNADDNKPHRVYGFHQKYFTGGEEWRINVPK
jgi:hypothetical protein